jgi:hypothetical protein
MSLLSLPLEILQQVADCVEAVHRPSLYALGLTSKACYEASTFLIFRQLSITVHHSEGLRRDADRLLASLSRTGSTHHVRCIVIKGALRLDAKKSSGDVQKPWWIESGLGEILENEEPIWYSDRYIVYDEPVIYRFSDENMAWAPVVSLLQAIPHLKDLIYDCQSQFPPSLLKLLHGQHPQCRLHHLTFRFRTLLLGVPYPYEMELATSPSLYRVKVAWGWRDTDGEDDFNLEALMELTSGLAPNLKEVTVLRLMPMLGNRYRRSRGPWRGLPGYTGKLMGSLTSLSLSGYSDLESPAQLQAWARHTDFSCLQHLTLGGCYDSKSVGLTGETMEWVFQNQSFPQLRTLGVYLNRDDMYHEKAHYSENAVSFFQAFEALEELSVTGPLDSLIVDAILSRHGQTLKKLSLHPYEETFQDIINARVQREIPMEFTKGHLLQIRAECPALEALAIPVKRNKSSASETELYKCFAEMESLKYLFLTLDCSNWRVTHDSTYNPQFDEEDKKVVDPYCPYLKRGILKETYINCAVDESLARSIWNVISKNKTGRRLERLKLWTTGGKQFGTGDNSSSNTDLLDTLSRSWLIERVPRDDQEDITIRELGQREREARDAKTYERRDTEVQKVFREVWPRKEGSKSWQDDWSSFPLQI